jgi:hypothetical protein
MYFQSQTSDLKNHHVGTCKRLMKQIIQNERGLYTYGVQRTDEKSRLRVVVNL